MKLVSVPAKTIAAPLHWGVTRLDANLLVIVIATITVFYQIESTVGDLVIAAGFAFIPSVMWLLGARFVATRKDRQHPDTASTAD